MKNGKVDIADKCIRCGKLTDNDTGKIVKKGALDKYVYINNWICGDCGTLEDIGIDLSKPFTFKDQNIKEN